MVATEPAGNWPDSWSWRSSSQPWIFALCPSRQKAIFYQLFKVLSLGFEHRFQIFYRIQDQTENIKDALDLKFELVSKTPLHNFPADFRRPAKMFPQEKDQFSSLFLEANPSNL